MEFSNGYRKARGGGRCCVPNCNSVRRKSDNISFHTMPSRNSAQVVLRKTEFGGTEYVSKRDEWLRILNVKDEDKTLLVCSLHFVKDDYNLPDMDWSCRFLKRKAVPQRPNLSNKKKPTSIQTIRRRRPESTMVTYGHNNAANVKNKSRADSCFVPMCPSTSTKFPNKLFLTGPSDPELRNKWFQAAKRDEHYSPKTIIRCCEDHFDLENDVENWIKFKIFGGKIFLKKDVVPHIFECQNRKLPMKPRLALMKRKRSEILEGTSAPLISETHGCQKPIISNEQGAKVTFTCGLCETTCKKYIGHPCLMNFKEVYVDKNGYFYPMMNDKKAYLRHGILGDGTEGIIVEQRNFSADKASTSSEVPSTTEKHQSNGFENWKISVSDEDVELLLKKVHERIPLWNYTIPIWERRWDIIQSLWKEVSAALDGRLNPDQCKVKFRSLRDTHRKIVNAELNGTDRSKPLWRFYHSCEFLRDHMLNSTHSHTPQMSDVDDDSQSDDDDDELIVEDHDYLAEIRSKPETNKYYQLPTLVRAPKR